MKILFLTLIIFISFSQVAFADAKSQLKKVNAMGTHSKTFDLKLDKNQKEPEPKIIYSSEMTNLQYDESNFHYDKWQKYTKDNIEYSQSGRMKY